MGVKWSSVGCPSRSATRGFNRGRRLPIEGRPTPVGSDVGAAPCVGVGPGSLQSGTMSTLLGRNLPSLNDLNFMFQVRRIPLRPLLQETASRTNEPGH